MRKIFTLFVAICFFSIIANAEIGSGFGVVGGANFSTANVKDVKFNQGVFNNFHTGLAYKFNLPLGFAIQPALQYTVKGAKFGYTPEAVSTFGDGTLKVSYLELPVSFQWGPDLILFRPYLDFTPFVGYALEQNVVIGDIVDDFEDGLVNKLSYGVGLGVGVEFWKLQIVGRYNWNLGSLSDGIEQVGKTDIESYIQESFVDGNFSGITLSLALFF